jgi:hypothetical protein
VVEKQNAINNRVHVNKLVSVTNVSHAICSYEMVDQELYILDGDTVVRSAKISDFQAVMDIDDNVYDGLDYLPSMYFQFLQSRHHLMVVWEVSGKIVSLWLLCLT